MPNPNPTDVLYRFSASVELWSMGRGPHRGRLIGTPGHPLNTLGHAIVTLKLDPAPAG